MGRSVDYLNNAEVKIFFSFDYDENSENDSFEWDDLMSNLKCKIKSKLPSYNECDKWEGREVRIILQNNLCNIGLSEYCGLVSLSIAPREDSSYYSEDTYRQNFAIRHANQIEKTLRKIVFSLTRQNGVKIGSFSNGEGVYKNVPV